ncbi:hypothetical protein [Xanthomonas rydalmerensis]|uniref:Uncharacterized protein n=1 Tax=Xanthomonas rydalmerensis TaxID=3046274 RepID=A0ABZ0JSP9_9XANT|nr:hypothetical protein [Xanthomonas sp. DM-2023]WOS42048.1 hypothetical protein QN243_06260 [Xanthomonas sp. DM-2023]WOS46234.1 hypothetical protein QN242_06260 [Xanthomonas sp. DM-2023]WOS50413.1 hypothetical protein QN240_06260 [Xanthomonas sp. DM-2023]WOS54593.1 hypothetical protein QN244_06260 [Xanthomonas sp. DM-2023]WOS58776.1 hypothetical protein QN245_06260 [Xanthomonas sp. DM-2023]
MQDNQATDFATLRQFAESWLRRPLRPLEEEQLRRFASESSAPPAVPAAETAGASPSLIDAERERVKGLIQQMQQMQQMQNSRGALSGATVASEAAVLKAVQSANVLDQLRSGQLRPPQNGEGGGNHLVMAQIDDRLAKLVQTEVQACFDREFGTLTQQMQAVLEAARAQGLIADAPATEPGAPSPPPAA